MDLSRRALMLSGVAAATLLAAACSQANAQRAIKVYKLSECTCCEGWVDHLKAAGFKVEVEPRTDLAQLNRSLAIPDDLTSCHVGVIGAYAISGHVPAEDIKKLLALSPNAKGLAVPGMPINSPGMEVAGEPNERYTVWQFEADGKRTAFAQHG